jgi:hypothetical protein
MRTAAGRRIGSSLHRYSSPELCGGRIADQKMTDTLQRFCTNVQKSCHKVFIP